MEQFKRVQIALFFILFCSIILSCKQNTYSESTLKEYTVHKIEAETFRGTTDNVTFYRIYLLSDTYITSVVLDANQVISLKTGDKIRTITTYVYTKNL